MAAMDPERYEVVPYLIGKDGRWNPGPILPEPGANRDIDVAFPVLHGTFGEDGTVQGLLELADIPYVGANVLASAASMDKDVMKRLCRDRGLPIVEYVVASRAEAMAGTVTVRLSFPMFVKPANLGSSVGISKAHDGARTQGGKLKLAAQYDRKIVVERGIEGREFECAVLGERPSRKPQFPAKSCSSREFYDYEDKYELNLAQTVLSADLPAERDHRNPAAKGF